ncbi:MAG TPA: AAA family ATPase, partial [Chloroflexota bacterium]|nr:AAA family ATPase [Chloroflexota bacterium]
MANSPPAITRVVIENYKSIAVCDVRLEPLIFLVGRNGAGKSNFLDAFRFLAEALQSSLDAAMRTRGGFETICFKTEEPQAYFRMHFELSLPSGETAEYGFRIARQAHEGYGVVREECRINHDPSVRPTTKFQMEDGHVLMSTIRALGEMLQLGNVPELPRD